GDASGLAADLRPEALAAGSTREAARLDGAFAVLAFDPGTGRAALATDRFGLMPLYCRQADGWCCATSLALALALDRADPRGDAVAAFEMLVLHMALGDRTLIDGVHLVPPATLVTVGDQPPHSASYWNWRHLADPMPVGGDVRDL